MKTASIKRLVLALILSLGSFLTLPAHAWPDTDEMNMCGAAIKTARGYAGDHRGWAAHDNYVAHLRKGHYYRNNCPQSKATKNYKGKNWAPGAKMHAKPKRMKHKHKKHMRKHHGHNPNHKNHADCVRVDSMNKGGHIIKRAPRRTLSDDAFMRQAYAALNMRPKMKHRTKLK